LEKEGLISVKTGEKGRVAVITMLRPKPITVRERSVTQDDRPLMKGETNNNNQLEYKNNTSQFCLSLLLSLLDREPIGHEMKAARELVQHLPADRIVEVVEWARNRQKPFGAARHALEEGYEVGPKARNGFHARPAYGRRRYPESGVPIDEISQLTERKRKGGKEPTTKKEERSKRK